MHYTLQMIGLLLVMLALCGHLFLFAQFRKNWWHVIFVIAYLYLFLLIVFEAILRPNGTQQESLPHRPSYYELRHGDNEEYREPMV